MKQILLSVFLLASLIIKSQTEPQWLFPIWFEDANGDRDTVYIGYDPTAGSSNTFDEEFEDYIYLDTSKFNAVIDRGHCYSPYTGDWNEDSCKKEEISGSLTFGSQINFIHGQMPIMMFWSMDSLYSTFLPYPNLYPFPNAIASVECGAGEPGYINCPSAFDDNPLTITNQPNAYYTYPIESPFLFDGSGTSPSFDEPEEVISPLDIIISPYTIYDNIINISDKKVISYPNPVNTYINITCVEFIHTIKIYNLIGLEIACLLTNNYSTKINLTVLEKGTYTILIHTNSKIYSKLIIKQ